MPEILAQSDRWIFAASTMSDGDMFFSVKQAEERDEAFEQRKVGLFERLGRTFQGIFPSVRSFHIAKLCHGDQIATVTDAETSKLYGNTDGLATDIPRAVLRVTGADCPPIFLSDPDGRIALAHSGRVGTKLNITEKAVQGLVEMGSEAGRLQAVIGPGICGRHYEVSEQIAQQFKDEYPEAVHGRYLDLRAAIRLQLVRAGLSNESIRDINECTFELSDKWFSHRRDVRDGLKSDPPRILSFVAMLT